MGAMRKMIWVIQSLSLLGCCLGVSPRMMSSGGQRQQSKVEETVPTSTTMSPPEGNTTFIGGSTWCVALPGVAQADLQVALDWACGTGSADCEAVQPGRDCFQPDTLLSHASYAFNSYYQENGNSDIACNFGGTAAITTRNPSYGSCKYPASETSAASPHFGVISWELVGILMLLLYF